MAAQKPVQLASEFNNQPCSISIVNSITGNSKFLSEQDNAGLFRQIERLNMQRIAHDLHLWTLAEYYKLQRIPRGLRSHLRPTMFMEDANFKNRWEAILNKCSFDIMLLIMDRLQQETPVIMLKVEEAERKIRATVSAEQFQAAQSKLDESLRHFRLKLESRKRGKFLRDETDYTESRVYRWTPRERQQGWNQRNPEQGLTYRGGTRTEHRIEQEQANASVSSSPRSFLYGSQDSLGSIRSNGEGEAGNIVKKKQPYRRRKMRW
ncbi:hypothetical protein XELAEV_18011467mg [Xenopus laevis]|uniref:Uncharacterized protein n=1 Tax=Xenopus laevis TaxID=8355 RepID=A0A974HXT2_XENLA|nr:hypothetical protein XELAEV_18011467mg [Xenopus laevis]